MMLFVILIALTGADVAAETPFARHERLASDRNEEAATTLLSAAQRLLDDEDGVETAPVRTPPPGAASWVGDPTDGGSGGHPELELHENSPCDDAVAAGLDVPTLHVEELDLFSAQDCDKIIAAMSARPQHEAGFVQDGKVAAVNKNTRSVDMRWAHSDDPVISWAHARVVAAVARLNADARNRWGIALGDINDPTHFEPPQYLEYTEANEGHYGFHSDNWPRTGRGTANRAFSVSVQLSAGDEYDGGGLQVGPVNATRKRGAVVVFPSYVLHKVHRITKGTRKALVIWVPGRRDPGASSSGAWTGTKWRDRFWKKASHAHLGLLWHVVAEVPCRWGDVGANEDLLLLSDFAGHYADYLLARGKFDEVEGMRRTALSLSRWHPLRDEGAHAHARYERKVRAEAASRLAMHLQEQVHDDRALEALPLPVNVSRSTFTHLEWGAQTRTGPRLRRSDLSAFELESSSLSLRPLRFSDRTRCRSRGSATAR